MEMGSELKEGEKMVTVEGVTAATEMWINMGPQHPFTHGLWDLKVKVDGEIVVDAIPLIGYLHRSVEKIGETSFYEQFIPVTDRLCYVASMSWSTIFVTAVEDLMGVEVPERAQYIRVIMLELQRLASHLMWLGAWAADLGLMTMFLMPMRDRDLLLDLFEMVTGARMTYNYPRIGGVRNDFPKSFSEKTRKALDYMEKKLTDYESMMERSEVFLLRTKDVSILKAEDAINLGVTGPILRASSFKTDLRRDDPYLVYDRFDFNIPIGRIGDTYDRYKVRMIEMAESIKIIRQALDTIPEGKIRSKPLRIGPKGKTGYSHMEDPRGEGCCYVVGDGTDKPYRVKFRSPAFVNVSALPHMLRGYRVADVPSITGSIDVCLGEIDR